MSGWIRQGTAITVKYGPFQDTAGDPTTGLTIQKAHVRLSKNGGNMAPANADQGVADAGAPHDELGVYDVSLNATDTNTPGSLRADTDVAGALNVWDEWTVVPQDIYDIFISGAQVLEDSIAVANTIGTRQIPNGTVAAVVTANPTNDQALLMLVQRMRNATRSGSIATINDKDGNPLYTIDFGSPTDPNQAIQQ